MAFPQSRKGKRCVFLGTLKQVPDRPDGWIRNGRKPVCRRRATMGLRPPYEPADEYRRRANCQKERVASTMKTEAAASWARPLQGDSSARARIRAGTLATM